MCKPRMVLILQALDNSPCHIYVFQLFCVNLPASYLYVVIMTTCRAKQLQGKFKGAWTLRPQFVSCSANFEDHLITPAAYITKANLGCLGGTC